MTKFGPSGNSNSFYAEGNTATEQAPKWLAEKGLDAFEYSFGRGVNLSDTKAELIAAEMKKYGVEISVHSPYYVNFANTDDAMAEKSYGYVLASAKKLVTLGGNRVVFHPASLGKLDRETAVKLTKARIGELVERIYAQGFENLLFCPETMGKINQIGTLEEVVEFCKIDKVLVPAIDFGHLNARTMGGLKTEADYEKIIQYLIAELGERAEKIHVHFSKIEYGKGGEIRHLTMADTRFGPEFEPLARLIKKYRLNPVILSESDGTQAEDALLMKKIYSEVT